MVQHSFLFADPYQAKRFVERLCLILWDIAIYRDELHVSIIDGREPPQTEEILRLARASSASWAKWKAAP